MWNKVSEKNTYSKLNGKPALNIVLKVPKMVSGLLFSLGKPFYLVISYSFLGIVSIFYITGRLFAILFDTAKPISKSFKKSFNNFLHSKRGKILPPWKKLRRRGVIFVSGTKNTIGVFSTNISALTKISILVISSLASFFLKRSLIIGVFIKDRFSLFVLKRKLGVIIDSRNFIKILTMFFASGFLVLVLALFFFWLLIIKDLPPAEALAQRSVPISTKIYDRNGNLLYTIFKDQNRTPVPLSEIPVEVRSATIAIEDAEFYSHPGFSVRGISRAIVKDFKQGKMSGGSTITQQLVKNTLLTPEKTLVRKLKELVLAVEVELTYNKNEILEMYLNEVSYGGTAYGIQEAAKLYFSKDVKDLTLAEAAFLAGLPKSPSNFSPFGSNPEGAIARQKDVLNLMHINGFISEEQQNQAENEELKLAQNQIEIKAPHFVFYVKEALEKKYGKEVVEKGGLEVITTLDLRIQELAEKIVREEVDKLLPLNVTNGAAVVLDPQTGEILAMVGSKNYFDTDNDGNVNVTIRERQPGSSIKVVNYAYALGNNMTAATLINDSPTTFMVEDQPPYTPKNYEGGFRGNLTLRSALAESRNIPAVKVLASYGVKDMIEMGHKMGITTWENPNNYGLSLTLGGGEVKLLDLAQVYATLANYGVKADTNYVLKITDPKGKLLEELSCREEGKSMIAQAATSSSTVLNINQSPSCPGEKILDPRVSFIITDILRDNSARSPSFGSNSLLNIPNHKEVAVKTGTSNNLRDNLTVGYTQDFVVAVWVGNNDGSEMARIASGVTGATPIWNKIMSALLSEKQNHEWPVPDRLVQIPICPYTGTLACEGCPTKMEWFLEENKPEDRCSPEWFKDEVDDDEKKEKESRESETFNYGSALDRLLESRLKKRNR
jgi:1A family penicillin-binding protein